MFWNEIIKQSSVSSFARRQCLIQFLLVRMLRDQPEIYLPFAFLFAKV